MMHGYNFTERVRKVLVMAREESARFDHEYVGTEHILLGLIREGEGVAATVLQNLNVDVDGLRDRIEAIVKRGRPTSRSGPDLPYTSRAKKVLELSMTEARDLSHSYVGTEHLLLGLLAEEKGIAAQVLDFAGVELDPARAEILRILGAEMPRPTPTLASESLGTPPPRGTVERVEVVLHYKDGRRFQASFESPHDAQGFLAWAAVRRTID
jgi:ATP-dependent Clp protease ATP-binding subunit ClpC